MTLWFSMGTAGELIKVYPLLVGAEQRSLPWVVIHTGQSGVNFWKQWDDFGLPRDKVVTITDTEEDLKSFRSALSWFFHAVTSPEASFLGQLRKSGRMLDVKNDLLFGHGDTISTLLTATWAWRLGVPLVHVEAGLRSPSLIYPFPEEINRRMTSEVADWHMVPDKTAEMNLLRSGFEHNIVNTGGNTLIETIRDVLARPTTEPLPSGKFCVANLHRQENLKSQTRWKRLVDVTLQAQKRATVYFAIHAPTERKLEEQPEDRRRLEDAGVQLLPRMKFSQFIRLIDASEFVVSDGGSNQEECYYLGKPCLILRDETERVEGLGENVVLSKFDKKLIDDFFNNPEKYRRNPVTLDQYPTSRIFDALGIAMPSEKKRVASDSV